MSFAENTGKNWSSKYIQKLLDNARDAFKTLSNRAIQKTAEATDDIFGKKNCW